MKHYILSYNSYSLKVRKKGVERHLLKPTLLQFFYLIKTFKVSFDLRDEITTVISHFNI